MEQVTPKLKEAFSRGLIVKKPVPEDFETGFRVGNLHGSMGKIQGVSLLKVHLM